MPRTSLFSFLVAFAMPVMALAAESYSPYAGQNDPTTVYWGDTHLHTALSLDASAQGNAKITPDLAYRFARGDTIVAHNDMKVKLSKPLDFLVVSDHAVNMGVAYDLRNFNPALQKSKVGQQLYEQFKTLTQGQNNNLETRKDFLYSLYKEKNKISDPLYRRSVWGYITATAEQYNDPGKFTAFIGYEWTSFFQQNTRHRVVIFKDDAKTANQVLPFSAWDSPDPEKLWAFFERYEQDTGGEILGIPHNPNLSNGSEFALTGPDGAAMTVDYAKARNRWEPLLEVTQYKGDSETHPLLSPTDEFADYETWAGWHVIDGMGTTRPQDKTESAPFEYARPALKLGLGQQAALGVNPFKFGMIGSTDSHSGFATAEENNYFGKHASLEPYAGRLMHPRYRWHVSVAGYAAVWATKNTREALFAAMKRKETYATTGPRMTVRFFGGWGYEKADAARPDLARIGYDGGVPMGGDLTHAPKDQAPKFLIRAVKDPDGANLDRVQVIKGWRDKAGALHEKIYNVVLSDGRKDRGAKTRKVGNTVDVKKASYTNTIGDPELATVWTDPNFSADELAFYYVRVIEIPTPRWPAYDAKFFKLNDVPEEIPMVTQERAYTSPIWYTP